MEKYLQKLNLGRSKTLKLSYNLTIRENLIEA